MHKQYAKILIAFLLITSMTIFASCAGGSGAGDEQGAAIPDEFAGREASDLSGYETMEDYSEEITLVDTDVKEIASMIDSGKTFAFIASYEDCPWCNRLMPYLNDAAREAGIHIGYINTRKDSSWQSNMDIDDYDLFVKRFRNWLEKDEEGKLHLYTPDAYFIKNGRVVERHSGVTEGADDPEDELTSEQEKQLMKELTEHFDAMR